MGGSGSGKAVQAQQQADANKAAQIKSSTAAIANAFNNPTRNADINNMQSATKQLYQTSLDKQYGDAGRNLKFALARNGQTGGSTSVDQNANLNTDYDNGILKITQAANAAGARVRAADSNTEQGLISLAQSGLDSGTAATQALTGMQQNIAGERAAADPTAVGNLFGSLSDFYTNSASQKAYNDANKQTGALYGNPAAYRGI